MLSSVTCNNKGCSNNGVEYLMSSQTELVMCGGCNDFIAPAETDAVAPELLPYIPNLDI